MNCKSNQKTPDISPSKRKFKVYLAKDYEENSRSMGTQRKSAIQAKENLIISKSKKKTGSPKVKKVYLTRANTKPLEPIKIKFKIPFPRPEPSNPEGIVKKKKGRPFKNPEKELINKQQATFSKKEKTDSKNKRDCFLCFESLNCTIDEFNLHIENCLINCFDEQSYNQVVPSNEIPLSLDEPLENVFFNSEQYEEYSWAGQTRVRASTFLEGSLGGGAFMSVKKHKDHDDDLDIDEDEDSFYGDVQFSEADLQKYSSQNKEKRPNSSTRPSYIHEQQLVNQHEAPENSKAKVKLNPKSSKINLDALQLQQKLDSQNFLIEGLKNRVLELQSGAVSSSTNSSSCLVCQDSYKNPLVSTGCWHVHCQPCWLQTLATKKLCPQCQRITFPTELRRIYL